MRAVFFSDIHGNEIAFERCVQTVRKVAPDIVFFMGDAVGYMPGALSVLSRLTKSGFQLQQGNHEQMLLQPDTVEPKREEVYRLAQARGRLSREMLQELSCWPVRKDWECEGRRFMLVHGSPDDPLHGYIYPDTDLSAYQELEYQYVVMGQTHRPFVRRAGSVTFVNTGSVGLPRDVGNLGSFAVYDSTADTWQIMRFAFDEEEVIRRYAGQLHPSVIEVLRRKHEAPFGERMD